MPTDYSQSKIYKLVAKDTNDIWIGSTTQALNRRFQDHKIKYERLFDKDCVVEPKIFSTECGMFLNHIEVTIELIEAFDCLNKMQLQKRVDEIINNNKEYAYNNIPVSDDKPEPKVASKRHEANKKYYEAHKDEVKATKAVREGAKSAEEKAEARRAYRTANKEAINQQARTARKTKALAAKKAEA